MREHLGGATVRAVTRMDGLLARARAMNGRQVDQVTAAALTLAVVAQEAATQRHSAVAVLFAAAVCATVAWRRRAPRLATLGAAVSITAYERLAHNSNLAIAPLAVALDYYMLGRRSAENARVAAEALLLAIAVGAIALTPGNSGVADTLSTWLLFIALPFVGGRAVGSRGVLTRELRANAERLEREQEERARRAASEERTRIARELHDVVAHSVSVMVIQTAAARRVAARDREAARAALASVESCGREALVEMRRMVGVLRRGDAELTGVSAPGLAQLAELAARARAAGLPVELRVDGPLGRLSPGLDLVAFRVVQEALTNAIKHAGPARAVVHVRCTGDVLELAVCDTGRGPAAGEVRSESAGHGLVGMRERVALYGGELETGRRRGGGFEVRARIPLQQAVPA